MTRTMLMTAILGAAALTLAPAGAWAQHGDLRPSLIGAYGSPHSTDRLSAPAVRHLAADEHHSEGGHGEEHHETTTTTTHEGGHDGDHH